MSQRVNDKKRSQSSRSTFTGGSRRYRNFAVKEFHSESRGRCFKRSQVIQQIEGKRPKLEVGKRLKEVDIGVTEFMGNHKGFSGIVKERYADFHVNEITLDGEITKLTDQKIPPEPEELEDIEELKKGVPRDIWDQLEMLMEADSLISSVNIDVTEMNKANRRAIHMIAKKIPNVISQTVHQGGNTLIVVAKANKQNLTGHKFRKDSRIDWGRRGGNYCHFLLHKVNMDTMDALNQIAVCLRIKSSMFNYAGTKDRRARTTQWVSVKKVSPVHILEAGRAVKGAYVGNFKFAEEPLRLGMLSGNRFKIALRNVTGTDEEIKEAMTSLRDNGFINYYGLQRFGTVATIPTHEIGKALLQSKWLDAIELILKPRAGEQHRVLAEAREIYKETKDALAAYKCIGRPDKIESKLLYGLHVCGKKNPQGALDWIPRNTRLMYIHAYQSFVWNHVVSRRIREFGSKPIVGDLVYENPNVEESAEGLDYSQQENDEEEEKAKQRDKRRYGNDNDKNEDTGKFAKLNKIVGTNEKLLKDKWLLNEEKKEFNECNSTDNVKVEDQTESETLLDIKKESMKMLEHNIRTSESTKKPFLDDGKEITETVDPIIKVDGKVGENKVDSRQNKEGTERDINEVEIEKDILHNLPTVKILTEEDLPNYTLADIVMPQPGWKVVYPPYAKPWFDEILAKDGLTTDLRQKNKKYTLGGTYRKMMEIASNLSWKIVHYKERNDELILCDVDEMRNVTPPKNELDGKYKALILEMSLRPCTYATMALREILKCDTSPQTQAAQSAANRAQEHEEEEKRQDEEKQKKQERNKDEKTELMESEESCVEEYNMEIEHSKFDEHVKHDNESDN